MADRAFRSVLVLVLLAGFAAAARAQAPSAELRYEKKFRDVLGHQMAYVETGSGDPIVFLHGNPTSSYLWRNVIPHLADRGRCIAPDLIGMGDSAKLAPTTEDGRDGRYRFVEHRRYLDALLDGLGVDGNVTLVLHDWGSALGFDWARRHPERVEAIAYMEAIVRPMRMADLDLVPRLLFQAMRGPLGELLVMRMNVFIEQILPMSVQRELSEAEMDAYRAPYLAGGEDRRPLLTWPREIPFDGEPGDTHEIISAYSEWLPTTAFPKLLVVAEPGAILTGDALAHARTFANQTELQVEGIHFVQEDAPDAIGRGIAAWMQARGASGEPTAPSPATGTE